jgi:hypothetical protein
MATASEIIAIHFSLFFMISSFSVEGCPRSPQTSGAVQFAKVDRSIKNPHGEINEKFYRHYFI